MEPHAGPWASGFLPAVHTGSPAQCAVRPAQPFVAAEHAADRRRRSSLVDAWRLQHVAAGLTRRLAGRLWAAREVGRDGDGRRPARLPQREPGRRPDKCCWQGTSLKKCQQRGIIQDRTPRGGGAGRRKAPAFQENRNILTSVNPHKSNMKISYEVSQNEGF